MFPHPLTVCSLTPPRSRPPHEASPPLPHTLPRAQLWPIQTDGGLSSVSCLTPWHVPLPCRWLHRLLAEVNNYEIEKLILLLGGWTCSEVKVIVIKHAYWKLFYFWRAYLIMCLYHWFLSCPNCPFLKKNMWWAVFSLKLLRGNFLLP